MKQDEEDLYVALSRYNWPYKDVVDLELVDWLSYLKTKSGKILTPQEIFNKQILKSDYVIFLIKNKIKIKMNLDPMQGKNGIYVSIIPKQNLELC